MSKTDSGNHLSSGGDYRHKPPLGGGSSPFPSRTSKSMEDDRNPTGVCKTLLTDVKWHSAPTAPATTTMFKTTAVLEVGAAGVSGVGGGGGGSSGGWKPLQRQKVVTAAPTLEEDYGGDECCRPLVTFPADGDDDCTTPTGDGTTVPAAITTTTTTVATERIRKRGVVAVRRGYSCQEPCVAGRRPQTVTSTTAGSENRRRWLSADTGQTGGAGNSRSMECLPSPAVSVATQPSPHHRSSFIMATEDRKSLDSGLDDVAAAEMADRRRGMFASTRTSVPSHLSLALPSTERRLTILSPHTHTGPSTPASSAYSSTESSTWHFCASTSSTSTAATSYMQATSINCKNRKKSRPGMVLPRLVLPGSSDIDIFSQ